MFHWKCKVSVFGWGWLGWNRLQLSKTGPFFSSYSLLSQKHCQLMAIYLILIIFNLLRKSLDIWLWVILGHSRMFWRRKCKRSHNMAPWTHIHMVYSPYCCLVVSYGTYLRFCLNVKTSSSVINSFILVTCMLHHVVLLKGEVTCWSALGGESVQLTI